MAHSRLRSAIRSSSFEYMLTPNALHLFRKRRVIGGKSGKQKLGLRSAAGHAAGLLAETTGPHQYSTYL